MSHAPRTINWYRVPLDPETLKTLHRRSDLKGGMQLAGHLGLIGILGTVAWHVRHTPALLIPVLFLYGTCYAFILNATHELSHRSVFKTPFLNEFFLRLLSFFGWRSYVMFWTSHAEHHKYTLHQPDDLEVVLPANLSLGGFLRAAFVDPFAFAQVLRHTITLSLGKVDSGWETHLMETLKSDKRASLIRWARFVLLGHTAIVAVSFAMGFWIIPVLTTFGIFYGQWLRFLCNNTQHAGLTDAVFDFRLCTRTVLMNPLVRLLYWNMNYHIEHHMYHAVPCYHLGQLHAAIRHELPESSRGLIAAWRQIIDTLKRQKTDPDYHYLPTLPNAAP